VKLVTFLEPFHQQERVGFLEEDEESSYVLEAIPMLEAKLSEEGRPNPAGMAESALPDDMLELLNQGKRAMTAAREAREYAAKRGFARLAKSNRESVFGSTEVRFKAPVPRPGKIIHTAGNFREHAKEGKRSGWEFSIPKWISFLKSPSAIVGHEDQIVRPRIVKELDHEIELAMVIGKKGKHLTKKEAWDSIAGFTVFNDISARDIQRMEMKTGLLNFGKNMDTFAPFGPCLVPRDDVGDVHNLKIECRVNGEPRQVSNTSHLSVSVPEIVSHYSWVTLYPGDIITTGTVSGVAAFRKNPEKYYLKPGDVLESEIENIGVLRNYIVQEGEEGKATPRMSGRRKARARP
jgi:2-keto-4-pentenoate hydratase/2-oxohepta-3-ene-1,7-dioic acid hydratase in catechol pathway